MTIPLPLAARRRTQQDVCELLSWIPDASALYLFSGSRLRWPLTVAQLQAMTQDSGLTPFMVVSASHDVVGHFDLALNGSAARLGRVIVNPALRGRGLAIAVTDLALTEAQRLGAAVVTLSVVVTNERAVRTYERAGFTSVEVAPARADIRTMERRLDASAR